MTLIGGRLPQLHPTTGQAFNAQDWRAE